MRHMDDNTPAIEVVPEPPWRRSRKPSPPRTPLTRDVIVEAAVRLLDREGLDALSMRAVSEELGTGAASLYWHVANKDELLDLVYDRILGEIDLPKDKGKWQEQLKQFAGSVRRAMGEHRDVARITLARIPTGPNAIVRMEWMLGVLRRAGLPQRVVAMGADAFFLYVNAFCYEEGVPFRTMGETGTIDEQGAEMLEQYLRSLPADRFPNFAALATDLTTGDMDERFEFGLDLLVRGFESFVRPKKRKG